MYIETLDDPPVQVRTSRLDFIDRQTLRAALRPASMSEPRSGFQRAPVLNHIARIAADLAAGKTRIENPLIVGRADNIPGLVLIDGQQRLLAADRARYDTPLPVMTLTYASDREMAAAFLVINTTRALPPTLLDELHALLDTAAPEASTGTLTQKLAEHLNTSPTSPIRGDVALYATKGRISVRALRQALGDSLAHGALRLAMQSGIDPADMAETMLAAIIDAFAQDWNGHTSATSRLLHGSGLTAALAAVDIIATTLTTLQRSEIARRLGCMAHACAWTSGRWMTTIGPLPWNAVQNTPAHRALLRDTLCRLAAIASL